ncbi:MAG: ATP-binding protein, partial [Polyangiaceae bacterium]
MTPYRSRDEPGAPKEAPTAGLVADMVRQFADRFAFVRELVQNGIDAGATALHVSVDRTSDGVTSVRVADDGCGMTLDIIESALLVLFRSTKDEDSTKIGKYGVGFMSVLAIDPSEVTIDTWRGAEAHRVRLFADHSFEIEQAAPRDGHGTVVSIAKVVAAEEFDDFWQDVAGALHRWCRHAEVPIHFVLIDGVSPEPRRARADRPFGVRAAVSVYNKYSDGMEIAVGPIAGSGELPSAGSAEDDPAPFAGFYNRGLTLHETRFAPHGDLSHVRVKVKSAALCHTLSRDDVRRDNAYHLGILRARQLVSGELREAAFRALNEEIARAVEGEAPKLGALLDVVLAPPISADADEIQLPLAHPVEGRR